MNGCKGGWLSSAKQLCAFMKWCCQAFQARYEQRHERGFFVYVLPPIVDATREPSFHLGMRALERSKYATFSEAMKGRMDGCMSLSGSTGIKYCPWCGVTLTKFYRKSWMEILDEKITDEFKWPVA
jgi:hypothetical protein